MKETEKNDFYIAPAVYHTLRAIGILILLAVGIFNTVSPYTAWYLECGWRYENAEPSEMALGMARFGGIVALVVAVGMMFV